MSLNISKAIVINESELCGLYRQRYGEYPNIAYILWHEDFMNDCYKRFFWDYMADNFDNDMDWIRYQNIIAIFKEYGLTEQDQILIEIFW